MAEENKKTDKKENKEEKEVKKVEVKKEEKVELSREYVIPLRRQIMRVPKYRRAKKAIRTIKEFLAKHMRVENRDLRDVKINLYLNNEVWYRGIRNPPTKIKVKAVKKDGVVYVELADVPEIVKFKMKKDERNQKVDEKAMKNIAKKEEEEKKNEKTEAVDVKDEKEKEKATVQAGQAELKHEAKSAKHEGMPKQTRQPAKRMTLQK